MANKEQGKIEKEKEKDQVTKDIEQYEREQEEKRLKKYQVYKIIPGLMDLITQIDSR